MKVSNNRLAKLQADVHELIEQDEENREIVLRTMKVLASSLSRNDSAMLLSVLADYDDVEV